MSHRITVVIPTYNRAADIDKGLNSLRQQSCQDFSIIVVDNSSSDNTAEIIEAQQQHWQQRLAYIKKPPNGPASARNLGTRMATGEFIVYLDSDIQLQRDWLQLALDQISSQDHIGAVGGLVIYDFDHSKVNAFGGDIGHFGLAWDLAEGADISSCRDRQQRIWANCSAMISRRRAFEQVAGFDEEFFYGYEDSDYGWKLNLAGFEVWLSPELKAYHNVQPEPGPANDQIVFHYCKNRLRSLLKNSSAVSLLLRLGLYTAYSLADLLLKPHRGAKLRALLWNLQRLGQTLALRRAIQSQRKLSDRDIFKLGEGRFFPSQPLNGQRRRPSSAPKGYQQRPPSSGIAAKLESDDRV